LFALEDTGKCQSRKEKKKGRAREKQHLIYYGRHRMDTFHVASNLFTKTLPEALTLILQKRKWKLNNIPDP
jgi:hypothetical protein